MIRRMNPRLRGVAMALALATALGIIQALVVHGYTRAERCLSSMGRPIVPSSEGRPIGQKDLPHE